jgi:hypothetical protein
MISIVVSSYKKDLFNQLRTNIENTIGVDYEIIKIDNPNLMGICEAYNLGTSKSKYEIILFCHEDLIFRSKNWGKEILSLFETDSKIGLIGLAGCKVKSYVASGWHTKEDKFLAYNFIQSDHNNQRERSIHININKTTEVACIDGFFMASKKDVILKNPFDSYLLKGFHGYDLDISLALSQKNKIVISHVIKVEHLSLGRPDKNWFQDILKVNDKYRKVLPIYTNGIRRNRMIEYENLKFLLSYVKSNQIKSPNSLSLIYKYYRNIGFLNFIKINIYLMFINFRQN